MESLKLIENETSGRISVQDGDSLSAMTEVTVELPLPQGSLDRKKSTEQNETFSYHC